MSQLKVVQPYPLILRTSLTTIDENTTAEQAKVVMNEIEVLYNHYYGAPGQENTWTWDDVHERDRDALVELEEVIRARTSGTPMDMELVSSFRTDGWKRSYRGMYDAVMSALSGSGQKAADPDGVSGQDRKSYTDDQDRSDYVP